MKVTKSYIKQLVKEELRKVLRENEGARDFSTKNFEQGNWIIGRALDAVDGKSAISRGAPLVMKFEYDPEKAEDYQYIIRYWGVQDANKLATNPNGNGINPFANLQPGQFLYSSEKQFKEISSLTQTYGGQSYFLTPEQAKTIGIKI